MVRIEWYEWTGFDRGWMMALLFLQWDLDDHQNLERLMRSDRDSFEDLGTSKASRQPVLLGYQTGKPRLV
jgi:hypothetical protein